MPVEVVLPRLTHDMQAGVFVEWYKREGDPIERGEVLYAVETDKATVDVEAEADGILGGVMAQPGDEIAIGQVIAYLLAPGEQAPIPQIASSAGARRSEPSLISATRAPAKTAPPDVLPGPDAGVRVVATPLARRVAREKGLDLRAVRGSGPRGRVVRADVVRAAAGQPPTAPQYEVIARTHIQDRAAARLTQMWQETPQFVLEISADMTEAIRWREETKGQMSFTTLLVRVTAAALRREPQVNSLLVEGELRRYQAVNVGVAMATGAGLVVPVIHHADRLTAGEIQARLEQLRARAETGRLEPADFSDGTFTLSNLGMYGVDAFTAIINPPQVAILACGRIVETPIELSGQVAPRPMLRLRLTGDHRALDGAQAAPFLLEVKRLLENPHLLT
jgi:pyruvate dehydrogenase E2 component (dihydrolipoamide acetyltransferase)